VPPFHRKEFAMPFGKRQVPPGHANPPPGPTAAARSAAAAMAEPPEFPSARRVTPNLIEFGDGESTTADGATRIVNFLTDAYCDQGSETLLSAAGALAGFAAQQALWEALVRPGKVSAEKLFMRVTTKSGETFFFGDFLNKVLASTQTGELSIWRLVAAGAALSGARVPSLEPLFEHAAATIGSPEFGTPAFLKKLQLKEPPREALRHWPQIKTILVTAGKEPFHWPLEIAVATQKLIEARDHEMPPDIAALIVMEAAIPMSKVDPRTVPGGTM
jgi:hypothetical protein